MIKVYGMKTCPDCSYIYDQIKDKASEYEYVEIGEHVKNLKEFLIARDNNPIFKDCKSNGSVGIPYFVLEDGKISLTPEDVGLKSRMEI